MVCICGWNRNILVLQQRAPIQRLKRSDHHQYLPLANNGNLIGHLPLLFTPPFFLFPSITPLVSYLPSEAICLLPADLSPVSPNPRPLSCVVPASDTGSPRSDFILSSLHPLKWRWTLGPRWPDSTLALGPLNANKSPVWIIDTNTTNEETLSGLVLLPHKTLSDGLCKLLATNIVAAVGVSFWKSYNSLCSGHFLKKCSVFLCYNKRPKGINSFFFSSQIPPPVL